MFTLFIPSTRRDILGGVAAIGAASLVSGKALAAAGDTAVRPFKVAVPDSALADMRRRILDTRWADKEPVADDGQGVQRGKLEPLIQYWAKGYDWRKVEARAQRPADVHDQDRRPGHPVHPCPLTA